MHLVNKLTDSLFLPGLAGQFGQWYYYQVVMRVADIVKNFGSESAPSYRIKTFDEVEEIYSQKGVSKLLQRDFDPKRLLPIKKYLLRQPDKYVNNLTVAIFGGSPDWIPVDISTKMTSVKVHPNQAEFLNDTFGVVSLTGAEILFVLDGQHRLKGLRAAYLEDEEIGEETLSVTLIIHEASDEGRERTRRLFSTVNRHAKPVSLGENILLDEDDVSAIVTRRLIEEYPIFRNRDVVALNKSANLYANQFGNKFTTVITLYHINEILLDNDKIYQAVYEEAGETFSKGKVRVRPDIEVIDKATDEVFAYWNLFFELFPAAVRFIEGDKTIGLERNSGGPFYLRPVAQEVIAMLYKQLQGNQLLFKRVVDLPTSLNDNFWYHIMWDGSHVLQAKAYIRDYVAYHFGLIQDQKQLNSLINRYRKVADDQSLELPSLYLNIETA